MRYSVLVFSHLTNQFRDNTSTATDRIVFEGWVKPWKNYGATESTGTGMKRYENICKKNLYLNYLNKHVSETTSEQVISKTSILKVQHISLIWLLHGTTSLEGTYWAKDIEIIITAGQLPFLSCRKLLCWKNHYFFITNYKEY